MVGVAPGGSAPCSITQSSRSLIIAHVSLQGGEEAVFLQIADFRHISMHFSFFGIIFWIFTEFSDVFA